MKKAKRSVKKTKCSWYDVDRQCMCTASVYHSDVITGKHFCLTHYNEYFLSGKKQQLEDAYNKFRLDAAVSDTTRTPMPEPLEKTAQRAGVVEALATIEKMEDGTELKSRVTESIHKIRSADHAAQYGRTSDDGGRVQLKTGQRATFKSIDIDFYCQNFKDDYFALITDKLKRTHAAVNMIMGQLLRIEEEEELIKMVEMVGSQMIDGIPQEFSNVTTRHATPFELKMKLFDTWMKAEKEYRELLKQRSETLVHALLILSKYGIRFDPKAGQLVIEVLHRKDQQVMTSNLLDGGVLSPDQSMAEENALIQTVVAEMQTQCPVNGLIKRGAAPTMVVDPNVELFEDAKAETVNVEEDDW